MGISFVGVLGFVLVLVRLYQTAVSGSGPLPPSQQLIGPQGDGRSPLVGRPAPAPGPVPKGQRPPQPPGQPPGQPAGQSPQPAPGSFLSRHPEDLQARAQAARGVAPERQSAATVAAASVPAVTPGATPYCEWTPHTDAFLGNFADPSVTDAGLEDAQRQCLKAPECRGVTCDSGAAHCSPRLGEPFLAHSPTGEVSYVPSKACGTERDTTTLPWQEPESEAAPVPPVPAVSSPPRPLWKPLLRQPLEPGRAVVVVIAHNREDCLTTCLASLAKQEEATVFQVAVSLDDPPTFPKMERVAKRFRGQLAIEVWRKSRSKPADVHTVKKISEHFRFALTEAFDRRGFEFGIFLENDLTVASDFLSYFRSTAWLLEEDPTLFCVSAWNDNGIKDLVSDETRLFRTDYFPGLGWMVRNDTWSLLRDTWPGFPSTGWDHWLRHGSSLRPRECIVPEVPRTHHFDAHGTNVKKGSPLAKRLAAMLESKLPPGKLGDLSYLLHDKYEEHIRTLVRTAELVHPDRLNSLEREGTYVLPYVREDYANLAKQLWLSPAQARTAHRGVVITRHPQSHAKLLLVDRRHSEGLLPEKEQWRPHPLGRVLKAEPGESCQGLCGRLHLRCDSRELEYANNCEALQRAFPCEAGCGHQVGKELPAYVHQQARDTGMQCLMTDDALPTCAAQCQATTRLCVCTPV